jgi:hypothetical protein
VQAAVVRSAAEAVLAETTAWFEADGPRVADRLYEAVLEDFERNRFAYCGLEGMSHRPSRGFVEKGLLYVFPVVIQEIAAQIGIGDPEAALRGLREDGKLVTDRDRRLTTRLTWGSRARMYAFRLPEVEEGDNR